MPAADGSCYGKFRDDVRAFIKGDEGVAWIMGQRMHIFQMVYDGAAGREKINNEIVPLNERHVPEMLALTKLTNPGPFAERTILFGHYEGIFDNGRLVAMAGQRMHPFHFAEISAVCTHPDHIGRGYARALIMSQVHRMISGSEIPFLHVKADNSRAIKIYEALGFVLRKQIFIYTFQKAD